MRAVKWISAARGLTFVDDAEVPCLPSPDHVLVSVAYASVCGSDLHNIKGEWEHPPDKRIMGHELSGTVVLMGTKVCGLEEGQHVTVMSVITCTECDMCAQGRACTNFEWLGNDADGGWAEYVVVPAKDVFAIPQDLPLETAVLCEPMCGVESIFHDLGELPKDSRILIIGASGVGILTVMYLYHHGFQSVTISQRSVKRREIARNLGFGFTVFSPEELQESFNEKDVFSEGFNCVIDTSSNPEAIAAALELMARRGKMVMYGGCSGDSKLALSGFDIFIRELTIMGVVLQPGCMERAIKTVSAMAPTILTRKSLGSQVYDLEDFQKGIDDMLQGEVTKAVFCLEPCESKS